VTETWLNGDQRDDPVIAELTNTLKEFNLHHVPRLGRSGGGVALLVKKGFDVRISDHIRKFISFEYLEADIGIGNKTFHLLIVYRPPPLKKTGTSTNLFFVEFSQILEELATSTNPLIICGDFNFHMDNSANADANSFNDLLSSAGLKQNIVVSTHKRGHILDLLISRADEELLHSIEVINNTLSDHAAIKCKIEIPRPLPCKREFTFRKFSTIDMDSSVQVRPYKPASM
jgi:exonuclease III